MAMINADEGANLIAVADVIDKSSLNLPNSMPYYTSIDKMLSEHPEIDVVNICSPNYFHAPQAIQVLRSGRHVVVEKPLALSTADALQIAQAEKESGKTAFMVMQNRYSPPSKWLKSLMDQKTLGKLYAINVNCFWNRNRDYYADGHWHGTQKYDGGTLFTQFSHYIDILLWLVGPIDIISASFNDYAHHDTTDFEDTGIVQFRTADGAMGNLNYSTAVPLGNLETSIIIIGEKGSVKVAGQYMNEVVHCNIENYTMPELAPSNPPNDYGAYKGSAANHCYVIENVVRTLNNLDQPTTPIADGINVIDTIERIYKFRPATGFPCSRTLSYRP